jgi:hypothetical protein
MSDTLILWVIIASVFAVLIASYLLVGERRFTAWDIALFTLPFLVWHGLFQARFRFKPEANLVEPLLLVPVFAAIYLVRAFAPGDWPDRLRSGIAFGLGIALAVLTYFVAPRLPERSESMLLRVAVVWEEAIRLAFGLVDLLFLYF